MRDINLPNGRFYQAEELTPTQQHDMVDLMTSLCAARVFQGLRDTVLIPDAEFRNKVFAALTIRPVVDDKTMMTEADITGMGKAKRRLRQTLETLLVRLPEYKTMLIAGEAAPGQGDYKEIVSSKAYELTLAYMIEFKDKEARDACKVELTNHAYMIGITK